MAARRYHKRNIALAPWPVQLAPVEKPLGVSICEGLLRFESLDASRRRADASTAPAVTASRASLAAPNRFSRRFWNGDRPSS